MFYRRTQINYKFQRFKVVVSELEAAFASPDFFVSISRSNLNEDALSFFNNLAEFNTILRYLKIKELIIDYKMYMTVVEFRSKSTQASAQFKSMLKNPHLICWYRK